ncbi:thermonuclease family protein [Mycobacterium dioxanotrophicus]|uniref:thermonuclease family protein n=1 Tax=Mycobacterium dioxanotrophicus TaxID=482462 RepID=UPI001E5277EC|nr:thermonuclease family protein [Mycobacterium dioxanotrophicus]
MAAPRTLTRLAVATTVTVGAGACAPSAQSPADPTHTPTATVLRAVDGDTIDVRDDTRGRLRIRVYGIDSPELHKPGWSVGCFATEAADFATRTLTGRRVALLPDPSQDAHDKYGRTLAYVQRDDGWNYSIEAVRAGMARAYIYKNNPASLSPAISAAEDQAKAGHIGLWGPPCNGRTESVRQQ